MPQPLRRPRPEPPEIAALRQVAVRQPELASAVQMQVELLGLHRRVESRLSTPWVDFDAALVAERLAAGEPVIRFEDISFEWTEFRLLFRQVTDLLQRYELLDPEQSHLLQQHVRGGRPDEADVHAWYTGMGGRPSDAGSGDSTLLGDAVSQVIDLTARPFLARVVATSVGRVDLQAWRRRDCPYCGGAPEMAVSRSGGDELLACGRCAGTWPYDARACVHCGNREAATRRSFASRDGWYRLEACDECRRYFKAYDASAGGRPLMLPVDTIATLPLDAAAQQRGYEP